MQYIAYFGTYTRGETGSQGIYAYRLNLDSGKMTEVGLVAKIADPSFLTIHPNNHYLYSVNERDGLQGGVSAFAIDPRTGKLQLLNQLSARGIATCYVSLDPTGRMLVVTNYSSGTVVSFPLRKDGRLAEAVSTIQHKGMRQPHPHSVNFSPDNRFVIIPDVGTDKVYVYRTNLVTAKLEPNIPPAVKVKSESGPRHLTFHPSGKICYVINEAGNTVTVFKWHSHSGVLEEIQLIPTLPKSFSGTNYTAEVIIHPSGKFLYGSNRGHDSIAVFGIDTLDGKLTALEHTSTQGKTPRNFNLDPTGKLLFALNQKSNTVVTFSVNKKTGKLTPTGQILSVPSPSCLRWVSVD